MRALQNILKRDKEKFVVPRRVQDVIPIQKIWPDGVFLCGGQYTKSFAFSDINYLVASKEDKTNMLKAYGSFLNALDSTASSKITENKHLINRQTFEESVLIPMREDKNNELRKEFNSVISANVIGSNGFNMDRYITISVHKKNIDEARAYFRRAETELSSRLSALGSECTALNAEMRLRILHDFYRSGEETAFHFDQFDTMRRGHDFRDYICPDYIEHQEDYLKIGDKYARVLFIKDCPSFLQDDLIQLLTEINRNMMLSIDIMPVPTDAAVREVERRILGVEKNITDWQRRQNANGNFSATVPPEMESQRNVLRDFLEDLTERDQRMMFTVFTLVHVADTKEQLDEDTEILKSTALQRLCQLSVMRYQQLDALNTALPIGVRRVDAIRTLTTEALSGFVPFRVQEIQEKGGIYFGENTLSHNLILCNMNSLLNQSMFLLGVPGCGKSFFAKLLIVLLALSTEDDIQICDPEGEYAPIVKALGGEVIHIAAGGKDIINAMDMVEGYSDTDPVVKKAQFIMSMLNHANKNGLDSHQKSIVDRCVRAVYKEKKRGKKNMPTLSTLRAKLMEQPEPEAQGLALDLELYTTGSLNIFDGQTNVNMKNRIVCYDIHDLGADFKPIGLLTITDSMLNRVASNWKNGKKTHLFIDEFHVVYADEFSARFFDSAWRQFRKRNACPCAITQNVEFVLDSVLARTMLSNSEFIVMLNQSANDRQRLATLLNISPEQMNYVSDVEAGTGLMRYGRALVPFTNRFPHEG